MIKINLAKVQSSSESASVIVEEGSIGGPNDPVVRRMAFKNLALILIGPLALFVYEQTSLPDISAKLKQATKDLQTLVEKNSHAQEALAQTKKFKSEQELLQGQIRSIENLKKDRLREVKVLDFVQRGIPEKVWLSRVELVEGKMMFEGYAVSDQDLSQLLELLSRSAYLREVSLIRSSDYLSQKFGVLKKFEVSSGMEQVN